MRVTTNEPMVPNEDGSPINPFNQDSFNMGEYLGTNVAIMYARHDTHCQEYMIIIDRITGERVHISFGEHPNKYSDELGHHCENHPRPDQQHKVMHRLMQ